MESGFKDLAKIKKQYPKTEPIDGKASPWDFRAPEYDQRSSCFVNAGTDYSVGHRQPVGNKNAKNEGNVPFGKVNTMNVNTHKYEE